MPLQSDINEEDDYQRLQTRWKAYDAYWAAVANWLPPNAKSFALSDWYRSDSDRNPHDAWVEAVTIAEHASGDRQQIRTIHITVLLLSASHDARIRFQYDNVLRYDLATAAVVTKHDDWLADEITLASGGTVLHHIVFASGTEWRIQYRDISYEYLPLTKNLK